MPKRSAEEKIERYERKIKKLRKRDIGRHRRIRTISDSSNNEGAEDVDQPGPNLIANANDGGNASGQSPAPSITGPEPMPEPDPTPEPEPALEPVEPPVLEAVLTEQNPNGETAEPELDPELLDALGESTSDTPEFGEKIHESLAKLWLPLLVKGLPKDKKETMLKEYLIPDNCRLLQAPKLNAEISAAVIDSVRNRDKILVAHQQQLGSGITAINRALNILLNGEDKKSAIQHLSNACRILSDLHTINTNSRIKLITPNLDKNFLHVVQDSVRDETLFGNKLSEKIKAAKAIERQGLQIKKPNPKPSSSQSTSNRSSNSGNWSGPPRYPSNRGNRGGKKMTPQSRRPYQSLTHQQPAPKPAAANKPRAPAP
ncbi:hypothetical protein MSG28_011204 [Choristoneura fumiferana]|uniref:Uncharacterized protein n=2 Tax=Choristoneura fumiferana TaxID=7141 RepID=A0ACC0K9Q2_CHOFU|nr:hypothetical protein MSG28_015261 [Choristoneura fumiferana]KAI8438858.1 hypothetical protein MSG28_011204 [Choristoneura fumiferana]